ncbi:MAG: DNA-binding protein [Candidatus Peribacteraceae bacterium]|nr:DNA-binding protein [Candidatus Peribacteraceae bacterium]MDP7477220.1 DNA-binding protein [Candidatus Peribacteraceae bacterium]
MQSRQEQSVHMLRFARGEKIVETLTTYLQENDIKAAWIQAIGAADHIKISVYNVDKKAYDTRELSGEYEILSIKGDASVKDGEIWPHLHIVLGGADYQCVGGHLEEAVVSATCEMIIHTLDTPIERKEDAQTGLKLWDLT